MKLALSDVFGPPESPPRVDEQADSRSGKGKRFAFVTQSGRWLEPHDGSYPDVEMWGRQGDTDDCWPNADIGELNEFDMALPFEVE